MDEASLRRRIRRLVFASPALSRALLAGEFRSAFKGRGMDFEAVREYEASDDATRMDWNATARFGRPFLKTYRDDRGLAVYLVVDESASMDFGAGRTKRETAALAASLVAYACSLNGTRVGALFFGGGPLEHVEPDAGPVRARILMERIASGPGAPARRAPSPRRGGRRAPGGLRHAGERRCPDELPGLPLALEAAGSHLKRRSLVMVLSDFMAAGYALPLALLARRHDAVAALVKDALDSAPPPSRFALRAVDAETGRRRLVVLYSGAYREARTAAAGAARLEWLSSMAAARMRYLELDAASDPAAELIAFFDRRRGR